MEVAPTLNCSVAMLRKSCMQHLQGHKRHWGVLQDWLSFLGQPTSDYHQQEMPLLGTFSFYLELATKDTKGEN